MFYIRIVEAEVFIVTPEKGVLTGWMNGRWELRKLAAGEMCAKGDLQSSISAIICGSFSQSHPESVLVIDAQGLMEIYTPLGPVLLSVFLFI